MNSLTKTSGHGLYIQSKVKKDGICKLVMILMICFLGLILISLFFIYIDAKRKSYLIEMYSYQIEYAKKYLR
ncbi:hypothetical protein JCM16816_24170 [Thermoanaerobacter brockii subsp. lactiethylicus]